MKRYILLFIAFFCPHLLLFAQDKALFANYQKQITQQIELVYSEPNANQRYHASEAVSQLFAAALALDDSFKWKWDFGNRISVLTAPDRKFRIITWPVVRDNGEYECFGFVQAYDEQEERYDVYPLNDKSFEIVNRDEAVLSPDNWLGAVYQELIMTSHDGRNFYTLLGWSGVDNLSQRKVIEPVLFRHNGSKPQFGQALFRRERNLRRVVFEYAKSAMVNLRYEVQTQRHVETVRVKKKGVKHTVAEKRNHDEPLLMIIFDEVAPQVPGMEGLFQYYLPTGLEQAYVFNNGKWELRSNVHGRLLDKRLNKEFAPIDKNAPAYQQPSD